MVIDEDLLATLEALTLSAFDGVVFRHMLANFDPLMPNTRGARWNPPEVSALYSSLEHETVVAEGDHLLAQQTPPPKVRRTVYRIRVRLNRVLDLRQPGLLEKLGLDRTMLESSDHWACQRIGEAVSHLGIEGILVPSARADGTNLVILNPDTRGDLVEVIDKTVIYDP